MRTKIVTFNTLDISQGNVATHLRCVHCVGIFSDQGRPQDFLQGGGCKAGDHSSNIFLLCVDAVCIPDPTVIEKVDFRLQCYVT